jgi:hypothetical protein
VLKQFTAVKYVRNFLREFCTVCTVFKFFRVMQPVYLLEGPVKARRPRRPVFWRFIPRAGQVFRLFFLAILRKCVEEFHRIVILNSGKSIYSHSKVSPNSVRIQCKFRPNSDRIQSATWSDRLANSVRSQSKFSQKSVQTQSEVSPNSGKTKKTIFAKS